jgi:hypothetical protein
MTNAEAPYCSACGYQFHRDQALPRHKATWKGRIAAIFCGLIAGIIVRFLFN